MSRMILCKKLGKEAPALDSPPFPGPIGEKIFNEISKPAWDSWINQQTMLINEYRLNMLEAKSRDFLRDEMMKFLFAEGSAPPPGYTR